MIIYYKNNDSSITNTSCKTLINNLISGYAIYYKNVSKIIHPLMSLKKIGTKLYTLRTIPRVMI
jgi:hypothetical protein